MKTINGRHEIEKYFNVILKSPGQWTVSKPEKVNCASFFPKCSFIMQRAGECGFVLKACGEHTENLQIQFSHFPSDWSNRTWVLQNCNKSLYNELHHIFTTSLTGFSTSSNQNPNLHKVREPDVKRGCRTNKIQCSKSLFCVEGSGRNRGEKDRKGETDTQTERALIKHDCMIFQPQRGEHRKAHSQSSSWGSAQGEGNSNL